MTAWIRMITDEEADPELRTLFDRARTPHGTLDNVMRIHSLRPQGMAGHVALYRSVLHNRENRLTLWFLEAIAVYTSLLNDCVYSLTHHRANFRRLLDDDVRADAIEEAFAACHPERMFAGRELALLRYAEKLTLSPGRMEKADIVALRDHGSDDGEILEVNQVCAYFNYANRLLNGLGVTTEGDMIGYYCKE